MEAAKPQAKEAAGDDMSMEEILQSIRRIIADDEKEGQSPTAPTKDAGGSDVLELTEVVKADGSTESLKTPPTLETPPPPPTAPEPMPPADVLSRIDEALGAQKPAESPVPAPAAPVAAELVAPSPSNPATPAESLLSSAAAAAAAASFTKLKHLEEESPVSTTPSPAFRSGATIEDMVAELLKPMMKEWLDANLPAIVERIVEREIKRLTR